MLELEQDSKARLGSEQSFPTAGMLSECPERSTSCSPRAGPTARGLCWRHHVMLKAIRLCVGPSITPEIQDPGRPVLNLCCLNCRLQQSCHSRTVTMPQPVAMAEERLSGAGLRAALHLLSAQLARAGPVGSELVGPVPGAEIQVEASCRQPPGSPCRLWSRAGVLPEASRAFLTSRHGNAAPSAGDAG